MSKPIILARSPFIVEINENDCTGSKIEIYIWTGTSSVPLSPTYTLQKGNISITDKRTRYDVSPYIKEYLLNNQVTSMVFDDYISNGDIYPHFCNVKVKRYKYTTTYVELDTTEYFAFDGYLSSQDDLNYKLDGRFIVLNSFINNSNRYYPSELPFYGGLAGYIVVVNGNGAVISGSEASPHTIDTDLPVYAKLVYYPSYDIDNTVEISLGDEVYQIQNKPKCLPKYRPFRLDFVNRFGVWQQEFFYGASKQSINSKGDEYQLIQEVNTLPNVDSIGYNYKERQTLNKNGTLSIQVNTDWIDESWNNTLKEIIMSENILLYEYAVNSVIPVKLNTNNIQLNTHLNDKLINYTLEFEYLSPLVNTVI